MVFEYFGTSGVRSYIQQAIDQALMAWGGVKGTAGEPAKSSGDCIA